MKKEEKVVRKRAKEKKNTKKREMTKEKAQGRKVKKKKQIDGMPYTKWLQGWLFSSNYSMALIYSKGEPLNIEIMNTVLLVVLKK